jgi:hypothetical protein
LGKKGGGNTERALKNGFGAIPYFLEIADVGEAYLIFEKLVSFRKCIRQTGPTD